MWYIIDSPLPPSTRAKAAVPDVLLRDSSDDISFTIFICSLDPGDIVKFNLANRVGEGARLR